MRTKDIRKLMRSKKVKVKDIASNLGVSSPFVSQVIHGVRQTQTVRDAISEAICQPVSKLWPEEQA